MTDVANDGQFSAHPGPSAIINAGGLRFEVSFRGPGATLRVFGPIAGNDTELLRFDDFAGEPHYHVPASAPQIDFDRSLGEPLAWYIEQVRHHLPELLEKAGYGAIVPTLDVAAISRAAAYMNSAMIASTPAGFRRVPGFGLERVE